MLEKVIIISLMVLTLSTPAFASLTKETVVDRIEILEDGQIQVRKAIRVKENGKILSQSFDRHVIAPDLVDISGEDERVQSVATALWTKAVKDAYAEEKASKEIKAP